MNKENEFPNIDRILYLLNKISPLPRLVNTPGLDKTYEILKEVMQDVIIHEYPAGKECEDWIVPDSWEAKEGYIKDKNGKTIASLDEHQLFVVPYSEPVDGVFTKEEIKKHLTTREDRPDAFGLEHRNAYNYQLVDWGISIPFNRWDEMSDEEYEIKIVVENKKSSMKVAEYFIQGEKAETICLCGHIDELCNDDLSGCILAVELMLYLKSLPKTKYSYQMLLVPEMFGPIFYADENADKINNTICMLNLETVGAGENWCLKKALRGGEYFEHTLRDAIKSINADFKEIDFFEGYGNDERVYAWPTLNIPGVSLQRHPFINYHTSEDTPELINPEYMKESFEICKNFIDIIEKDFIPKYTNNFQPWLSKRDLYFDSIRSPEDFHKFNNQLLFNINGYFSLLELAKLTDLNFYQVFDYVNKFVEKGLISKEELDWE